MTNKFSYNFVHWKEIWKIFWTNRLQQHHFHPRFFRKNLLLFFWVPRYSYDRWYFHFVLFNNLFLWFILLLFAVFLNLCFCVSQNVFSGSKAVHDRHITIHQNDLNRTFIFVLFVEGDVFEDSLLSIVGFNHVAVYIYFQYLSHYILKYINIKKNIVHNHYSGPIQIIIFPLRF